MKTAEAAPTLIAEMGRYGRWYAEAARRQWLLRRSRRRWLKQAGDLSGDVCLLAGFVDGTELSEETVYLARGWHRAGFKVVLIVATDRFDTVPSLAWNHERLAFLEGILERENCGYDFGSWSTALKLLGRMPRVDLLALTNDSVLGPFGSFEATIARIREAPLDVFGLTESFEIQRHIQSYAMFFKPTAFNSAVFRRFWRLRRAADRDQAILDSEIVLRERLEGAGLRIESLHVGSADNRLNPMLFEWRELLDAGFPFIKTRLIRERVARGERDDWPTLLARCGYPRDVTERYLAGLQNTAETSS